MIVISTRDCPGVPVAALVQMLDLRSDEVLVIIKTIDDEIVPGAPRPVLDEVTPRGPDARHYVTGNSIDATDYLSAVYTQTPPPAEANPDRSGNTPSGALDVYTPTAEVPDEDPRRRPATLADFATPRDGLGRNVPQPAVVLDGQAINRLGIPRLAEHGAILGDVRAVCHALHCTLQPEPDGRYQLVGTFGCKTFNTLGDVARALNQRSFDPD